MIHSGLRFAWDSHTLHIMYIMPHRVRPAVIHMHGNITDNSMMHAGNGIEPSLYIPSGNCHRRDIALWLMERGRVARNTNRSGHIVLRVVRRLIRDAVVLAVVVRGELHDLVEITVGRFTGGMDVCGYILG